MSTLKTVLLGGVLCTLPLVSPVAAQSPQQEVLTPDTVARITREVTAALHQYYDYYNERDMQVMAEHVYHIPFVGVGPDGFRVQSTPEEVTRAHEVHLANLIASGWARSEFPNPTVCVLNENAALASGQFTRYRENGSVLSVNANTYFFGRTDGRWRIFSFTGHPLDKVVTCND